MQFRINRKAMLSAVAMTEVVSRGAQVIEILKSLRIEVSEERGLDILGSDHACYVAARVPVADDAPVEPGVTLLNAKRLVGFLRSLEDDEIGFQTTASGKHMNILSTTGKHTLFCEDAEAFPTVRRDYEEAATVAKSGELVGMLSSVFPFSMWDGSDAKLQAVYFRVNEEERNVVAMATDRRRAAAASMPLDHFESERAFLMTNRSARALCSVLGKADEWPTTIGYQDGQLVIENQDVFFLARTVDDEFPYDMMIERFFDQSQHQSVVFQAEALGKTLDRVSLVADWQTPLVEFEFEGSTVKIGTEETAKSGVVEEEATVEGEATGRIKLVVRLLEESLTHAECGIITMRVPPDGKKNAPVFIEGAWGDDTKRPHTHLSGIMPITLKDPPAPESAPDE